MSQRIERRPEVQKRTGLGRTRLDELERKGLFPARVRISDRATGWLSDEVDAWIASRPRASVVRPDFGGDPRRRRAAATSTDDPQAA